jgi:hypothetical protein
MPTDPRSSPHPPTEVVIRITVAISPRAQPAANHNEAAADDAMWRPSTTDDGDLVELTDERPAHRRQPAESRPVTSTSTTPAAAVDTPAATSGIRHPGSRRRRSPTITAVIAAALIGGLAWSATQPPAIDAALMSTSRAGSRTSPRAPSVAHAPVDPLRTPQPAITTASCEWLRFDLSSTGIPGAGRGPVHRDAATRAIVPAPGSTTQTLYYRDCHGTRTYRWRSDG